MVNKNEVYTVEITDLGVNGEGIGRIDNYIVFVANALPGEIVKVLVVKTKKSYGYGKLLEIIKPSPYRVEPVCPVANRCGGCNLQHLAYEQQLVLKRQKVKNSLERIGELKDIDVLPTVGMDNPYYYRNKAQYPVGADENGIAVGFYAVGSHRIISSDACFIGNKENERVLKILKKFIKQYNIQPYNEQTHSGALRHIMIRQGVKTNELMVCLVINDTEFKLKNQLVDALMEIDNLKSLVINYNNKKTNVILGDKCETVYGQAYISDYIGKLKFNISPLSFFQVNPVQTEKLYNIALDFANLTSNDVVIDAYCGAGTISLFLAQKAKMVYGVEIVEPAVENAKENAKINNASNVEFFTGKSEEIVPWLCEEKNVQPDIMVVDPPRKGCDKSLLDLILKILPEKVVYVSCDCATLARDLNILKNLYEIKKIQPVDMFPHTYHVETVCLLSKKSE